MTKTIKNIPFSILCDAVKKISRKKEPSFCINPQPLPELRNVRFIYHQLNVPESGSTFYSFHHLFVLKFHFSGVSKGYVENRFYNFQPGYGILIFPFQMHKIVSTEPEGQFRLVVNFTMSLEDQKIFEPLRNKLFKLSAEDCRLLTRLVELSTGKTDSCQRETVNCLTEFLLILLKKNGSQPEIHPSAESSFARIFDYVYKHYREGLTVKELADKTGYSEPGIRLIFRREIGRTPGGFMQELAMRDATELLLYTDKSIQTISRECGFTNSFIFSRAFKNKTGKSPKAFRQDVHRV